MYETKCRYCGEYIANARYHRACVVDDAYNTILNNQPITKSQRVLYSKMGISIREIRSIVKEDVLTEIERSEKDDKEAKNSPRRAEKAGRVEPNPCVV